MSFWRRIGRARETRIDARASWAVAVVFAVCASAPLRAQPAQATQSAQTHWEQYKNRNVPPEPDQHLTDPALLGAIDLHVHHDPDSYPRAVDAFEVAKAAQERGLRGIVLKNHWTETGGLAYLVRAYATPGFEVFGAVTLDTAVGGLNPQAVRYLADVAGGLGRIVWMPTHDSEHEVRYNKESRPFVRVSRDGALVPEVGAVLAVVAERDFTLATGHVDGDEALMILRAAKAAGVKRLIVTHPLFLPQYTYMSLDQLRAAVDLGAYLEIVGRSLTKDGESKDKTLAAVHALGAEHFFVSSDAGLTGELNQTDTLAIAAKVLRAAGSSERDLAIMFKDNPAYLVKLPPASARSSSR